MAEYKTLAQLGAEHEENVRSLEAQVLKDKGEEYQKEWWDVAEDRVRYKLNRVTLGPLTPKTDDSAMIERRKWLDDTQNMRVVALNEARKYASTVTSDLSAGDIVEMAAVFAEFLIDGKS